MLASMFSLFALLCSAASTDVPTYAAPPGGYGGTPSDCARRWGVCGGADDYAGPTCCMGYNTCAKKSRNFSMCVPIDPMPKGIAAEFGRCDAGLACEPLTQCQQMPGPTNVSLCIDPVHRRSRRHDCSRADRWQQCGGQSWTGPTSCRGQNVCSVVSDYYSMCVPTDMATDVGCAGLWEQCAGKEFKGEGCCVDGTVCKFVNKYYSQCADAE